LEQLLEPVDEIKYLAFTENEQVIAPDDALPNSIIIFDNISCEKQNNLKAYFCMGRHKNVDCFYLCQSYTAVPKHLVRDNVDLLILFRQDDVNFKHINDDHVNTDMSYNHFKNLCSKCSVDGKHCFIVVDKDRGINKDGYRKGFD